MLFAPACACWLAGLLLLTVAPSTSTAGFTTDRAELADRLQFSHWQI
jgi:hypothetical protein